MSDNSLKSHSSLTSGLKRSASVENESKKEIESNNVSMALSIGSDENVNVDDYYVRTNAATK